MSFSNSPHRRTTCPKCRSSNWQGIEVAFRQSSRINAGGYRSISEFGQSISPPAPRSLIARPLFTAIGLGSTVVVFLPHILEQMFGIRLADFAIADKRVYIPVLIVAATAFVIHLFINAVHNAEVWLPEHENWRQLNVCRSCGHQWRKAASARSAKRP